MLGELTNNVFVQKVLLLVLITLLPLIPSYILFKFLPSESIVTGPFRGFQINFSGATALYFIIFITILTTTQPWNLKSQKSLTQIEDEINRQNYEVWKVNGILKSDSLQNYQRPRFRIIVLPQNFQIDPDGKFFINVLRKRTSATGEMEFPRLYINDTEGDYMGKTISLDTLNDFQEKSYDIQKIDSINKLSIKKPIIMRLNEADAVNENN